jgi:hypothetical protein
MERGDLVLIRGFVLDVAGGIATVAIPGTGERIEIAEQALEARAAPAGPLEAQAYADALRQRFADLLSGPQEQA